MSRNTLTANTTFYVATTGNDTNDGLTSSTPWLTIQHAFNILQNTYDFAGFTVTVQVADGTYTSGLVLNGSQVGLADTDTFILQGNVTTPSNCIISTSGQCIAVARGARLKVTGFKFTSSGAGGIGAQDGGSAIRFQNVDFGSCVGPHFTASTYSRVTAIGNYTISGSANEHMNSSCGQTQINNGFTVTIINNPNFASYFALSTENGLVDAAGVTYSGACTGAGFGVVLNSIIYTGGTHFPCNTAASYTGPGCQAPY